MEILYHMTQPLLGPSPDDPPFWKSSRSWPWGRGCTLDLVRSRFYWPFMATHIEKCAAHCGRCIRRKAPDPPRAPMKSFIAKEPMELLAIDFLSEWWNVSLDFQFTRSRTRMVGDVFSTATFCYRSEVHLLHQLPVLSLLGPSSLCSSRVLQKIPLVTSKSS